MNLAINQFLKLFSLSTFCTALLFSTPVLSLDTDGDDINSAQNADDASATAYDACSDASATAKLASASTLSIEKRLVIANPASNKNQQTFVRFVNPSSESVQVELYGTDDSGVASKSPPISLTLAAGESKQMTAQDLENGNTAKGLESSMCNGAGKWQITARSSKAIQIMGLIRTPDGFLTGLTDVVPVESGSNIVYFANPASTTKQQTFLRIVNDGSSAGTVTISAIDNLGVAAAESVSFNLGANSSKQMTAQDLENGNAAKGLTGKIGDGTGKWRLTIASSLDLSVQSLIRTPDGFLTNLSALVTPNASGTSTLSFFNPASNTAQQSFVRLVNSGSESASITISAVDDTGQIAPNGDVSLALAAGHSVELSAADLEKGNADLQLTGSLGVGSGRWRLDVSSDPQVSVMSYVLTSTGFLTNMSEVVGAASTTNTVWIFNPGSNSNQASKLRVINSGSSTSPVSISGIDDAGNASPGTNLTFNLSAGSVKEITAAELENGSSEKGLLGGIGDGKGKWRLTLTSDEPVTVQSLLETPAGFITNLSTSAQSENASDPGAANGLSFFTDKVSSQIVQRKCVNCHTADGVASGTELHFQLGNDSGIKSNNNSVLDTFINNDSNNGNRLLEKVRGVSHGGGVQLQSDSDDYRNMLALIRLYGAEVNSDNAGNATGFWQGVNYAPPEQIFRRAALIVARRVPTTEEINAVKGASTAQLRTSIRKLMDGPRFHDFLITGANDRLHIDGFMNGLFIEVADLNNGWIFPVGAKKYFDLGNKIEVGDGSPGNWYEKWKWGLTRAPLELIAHIVEKDKSYKEVVTADYMMMNPFTSEILRGGLEFENEENHLIYKPGKNQGQVVRDDKYQSEFVQSYGTRIDSYGDFIEYPHAGVLNTHAFLNRYPTTETNRNRARARWTYYHFLGVDIEKSAPRTTDPVALADTNNPTMNNTACLVCHQLMDPVAGAFQNFADNGRYRVWDGADSLPRSYKYPEDPDAERLYKKGDTWFQDMRTPGFDGGIVNDPDYSLQWLGEQLTNDPRFATAAVKFWWPATMGAEVSRAPEEITDSNYSDRLALFEEQNSFITSLGEKFSQGIEGGQPFNAKDLLTEMILSPWFTAASVDGNTISTPATIGNIGTRRLLTPEELEAKTASLIGRKWGANGDVDTWVYDSDYTNLTDRFGSYYGGIDSNGNKDRARAMSALMVSVAERQALEMACPAVMMDFARTNSNRFLFSDIEPEIEPNTETGALQIKSKIVELYSQLHGVELDVNHSDVESSYELLRESWEDRKTIETERTEAYPLENCIWHDYALKNEFYGNDQDPSGMKYAWMSILIMLMTDFNYLHE